MKKKYITFTEIKKYLKERGLVLSVKKRSDYFKNDNYYVVSLRLKLNVICSKFVIVFRIFQKIFTWWSVRLEIWVQKCHRICQIWIKILVFRVKKGF